MFIYSYIMNKNRTITPIVKYNNAYFDKSIIYEENKYKSGIYRWVNIKNNKSYIGSAKKLKYSYENFIIEKLEYCEQDLLISREEYSIDLLRPEYNICKIAGSTLGKVHSENTKVKIRNSTVGKNHHFYGKHAKWNKKKKIGKILKYSNRLCIMPKMRLETKLKLSLVTIGIDV